MQISRETAEDWWEVEALYDTTFAPGRTALSSYRLRDEVDPVPELCLVARDDEGILGGAVRHWPIRIGEMPALLLGPIAVHPTRQGEGVGGQLMLEALIGAAALGWRVMLLIGDAPYYRRFGFGRIDTITFPPPTNPERVLARALQPGALDGLSGEVTRWTA